MSVHPDIGRITGDVPDVIAESRAAAHTLGRKQWRLGQPASMAFQSDGGNSRIGGYCCGSIFILFAFADAHNSGGGGVRTDIGPDSCKGVGRYPNGLSRSSCVVAANGE